MSFKPSHYQQAVFDWVEHGDGDGIVVAVAGSGKTTTLVQLAHRIHVPSVFLAFNKHIAEELGARLAGTGMVAKTFHSVGNAMLAKQIGKPKVDDRKYRKLVRSHFERHTLPKDLKQEIIATTTKLADLVRVTLTDVEDERALINLCEHHNLLVFDQALEAIPTIVRRGIMRAEDYREIDFTDMIYLPLHWGLMPPQQQFVLVDECQDLNAMQLDLALRMRGAGGRMLFVGDQCQPAGTKVMVVRESGNRWHHAAIEAVNIEDLQVGDRVVSYGQSDCSFIQRGRLVNGITKRPYSGRMIVVTTDEGHRSRYTPNHHCFASFSALRDKHVVYLMQKGNHFRIGKARMDYSYKSGVIASGPIARARAEKVDALWLLAAYDTDAQATAMEGAIAGRFGLPELIFSDINGDPNGQKVLDEAWAFIGDNSERADACLSYFGRDIRYPLYDREKHGHYCSLKRPMIVHASNLMDGVLMLPYKDVAHVRSADWLPIKVSAEEYEGFVYSLDVEKEHLYVADGLTTHNCQAIYGFAGADAESFRRIKQVTGATELPLSICYRCPSSHLALAREIVPQIEARPDAPVGEVIYEPKEERLHEIVQEGDLILCRLTAPLVTWCIKLIQKRVAARVRGRDIGRDLCGILEKIELERFGSFEYADLPVYLKAYQNQQIDYLVKRDADESQIESVRDRVECLQVCFENFPNATSVATLCAEINGLFSDERSTVWMSTIHKAKGLENDRVIILKPGKLPLVWESQQPWQYEQEMNLKYVALTRAKQTLIVMGKAPTPESARPAPAATPVATPEPARVPVYANHDAPDTDWGSAPATVLIGAPQPDYLELAYSVPYYASTPEPEPASAPVTAASADELVTWMIARLDPDVLAVIARQARASYEAMPKCQPALDRLIAVGERHANKPTPKGFQKSMFALIDVN